MFRLTLLILISGALVGQPSSTGFTKYFTSLDSPGETQGVTIRVDPPGSASSRVILVQLSILGPLVELVTPNGTVLTPGQAANQGVTVNLPLSPDPDNGEFSVTQASLHLFQIDLDANAPGGSYTIRVSKNGVASDYYGIISYDAPDSNFSFSLSTSTSLAVVNSPVRVIISAFQNGQPWVGSTYPTIGYCFTANSTGLISNIQLGTPDTSQGIRLTPVTGSYSGRGTRMTVEVSSEQPGVEVVDGRQQLRSGDVSANAPEPFSFLLSDAGLQPIDISKFRFVFTSLTAGARIDTRDDGLNGDPVAGDGKYEAVFTFDKPALCRLEASTRSGSISRNDMTEVTFIPRYVTLGTVSDLRVDANRDGRLEQGGISVNLSVAMEGDYLVNAFLTSNGKRAALSKQVHLGTGSHTVALLEKAETLRDLLGPGTYRIEALRVSVPRLGDVETREDAGVTQEYTASMLPAIPVTIAPTLALFGVATTAGPGFDDLRAEFTVTVPENSQCKWSGELSNLTTKAPLDQVGDGRLLTSGQNTLALDFRGTYIRRAIAGLGPVHVGITSGGVSCSSASGQGEAWLGRRGDLTIQASDFKDKPAYFTLTDRSPGSTRTLSRTSPYDFVDQSVVVWYYNDYRGTVTVSTESVPAGVSVQIGPQNPVQSAAPFRLRLRADSSAAAGPASLVLKATDGQTTKTMTIPLQIQ